MSKTVVIKGDGIAACSSARLLQQSGFDLCMESARRSAVAALLVSPATQMLLADVFQDQDLFSGSPIIRKRVVLWGRDSQPIALPHSGVVISESTLLNRLWVKLHIRRQNFSGQPRWTILSSKAQSVATEHHFGSRIAGSTAVQLKTGADREACWIESVEAGWLFLLPCSQTDGSLICVGGSPTSLLQQSRLVSEQVDAVQGPTTEFPAYPRILEPLCALGWLACGTAAMGFDPLCGEGAGNAVREAILASAVVRAAATNDIHSLLEHFTSRLMAGFFRHLQICKQFYESAHRGAWWDAELNSLQQGIEWTQNQLSSSSAPTRYRLVGFELQPAS
jgi:2-polyprenyl-6-methoxyphenol hydroxylase-like FAD-dependent oxidoreductase